MRGLVSLVLAAASGTATAAEPGWAHVATFGRLRIVVVDKARHADAALYRVAAESLCGSEVVCDVMFWDDAGLAPRKLPADNAVFEAQTAEWKQNLQVGHRELLVACRLVGDRRPCLARY